MAVERNICGFEYPDSTEFDTFSASFSIVNNASLARTGDHFLRCASTATVVGIARYASGGIFGSFGTTTTGSHHKRSRSRIYFRVNTLPAAGRVRFYGLGSAGNGTAPVFISNTGQISVDIFSSNSMNVATVATGDWIELILDTDYNSGTGLWTIQCIVNGTSNTMTLTSFSDRLDQLYYGDDSGSAFTCSIDFDDQVYWAADGNTGDGDAAITLPTSTRVFPVLVTGQGAHADFTGAYTNVDEVPVNTGTDDFQESTVNGNETTFTHKSAGALQAGPFEALKVYAAVRVSGAGTNSVQVLINGNVVATHTYGGLYPTGDAIRGGFDWATYSASQFNTIEFGIKNNGTNDVKLGSIMMEALATFAPAHPTILGMDPVEGPVEGGTLVTITGSELDFLENPSVTFDGVPATSVTLVNSTTITCITPAHIQEIDVPVLVTGDNLAVAGTPGLLLYSYITNLTSALHIRRTPAIAITQQMGDSPGSATFKVGDSEPDFQRVVINDPVTGIKLHGGSIVRRRTEVEDAKENLVWDITTSNWIRIFNRRRPFTRYSGVPLSSIIADLVSTYAPEFSTLHVQTGMPAISIQFDGTETLGAAITRACKTAGNYAWYLDDDKDVHAFTVPVPSFDDSIHPDGPTTALTASVGSTFDSVVPPIVIDGQTVWGGLSDTPRRAMYAYAWRYADGRVSQVSPLSNMITLDGHHCVSLDGFDAGPDLVDGTVCVQRLVFQISLGPFFQTLDGNTDRLLNQKLGSADMMKAFPAFFKITDNVTTTVTDFAYGFGGFRDNTIWSGAHGKPVTQPSPAPNGPTAPPTVTTTATPYPATGEAFTWTPIFYFGLGPGGINKVQFRLSFVYANGYESAASDATPTLDWDGNTQLTFSSVEVAPNLPDGTHCVYRRIYAAFGLNGGEPTWEFGVAGTIQPLVFYLIPNNTDTTLNDTWTYTINEHSLFYPSSIPGIDELVLGPDPEAGTEPDEINDTVESLLKDPGITYEIDLTQLRNRVFVRGAGATLLTNVAEGATSVPISDPTAFSGTGGKFYASGDAVLYDSISLIGTTYYLRVPNGIPSALSAGTAISIWAQLDDLESQQWVSAREGGDGIYEYTIDDGSLTSDDQLRSRGLVELALFGKPIVTVTYATRDTKTRVGKNVTFNLTQPPIQATLRIQDVRIDQIHENDTLVPRYTVTATSVKFTLDDLLRKLFNGTGGGASSTPSGSGGQVVGGVVTVGSAAKLTTARNINGVSFDGTADISINAAPDHMQETPSGAINGVNAVYTTAASYKAGTLAVYLNGLRQTFTTDYAETTNTTFTMVVAPTTGDVIRVDYQHA